MKLVIKIGGAALDDKEMVTKFARTIPDLWREGHRAGDRARRRRCP